jgi:hypothetical protein
MGAGVSVLQSIGGLVEWALSAKSEGRCFGEEGKRLNAEEIAQMAKRRGRSAKGRGEKKQKVLAVRLGWV